MAEVPPADSDLGARPDVAECNYFSKILVNMTEGWVDIICRLDVHKEGLEGSCVLVKRNGSGG